jgi:hypothetical protein
MPSRAVSDVDIDMSIPFGLDSDITPNYHSSKMNTSELWHLKNETDSPWN